MTADQAQHLRPQSEVTWQELAAVVDALQLTPGYSNATGRAFVELNGELLYAEVGGVKLEQDVPGASQLQLARLQAFGAQLEAEREERLAGMTDEQRQRELEWRRAFAMMPDPPDWQVDAYLERQGRLRDCW